jgi:tetratricopeptide (TPR) repeat protein
MRVNHLRAAILMMLCLSASAQAQTTRPTVFFASESPLLIHKVHAAFYTRELPRQALIIAAARDLGIIPIDATLEPDAKPAAGAVPIDLAVRYYRDEQYVMLAISDDKAELDRYHAPAPVRDTIIHGEYDLLARKIDQIAGRLWIPKLATRLQIQPKSIPWNPAAPAPQGIDQRLGRIDVHHSFLAVRLCHADIAASGESPARLAALSRAYANLGESTRHLINAQSTAFFARSLDYARRLRRLAPDDPVSHYTLAYVQTLFGQHAKAGESLARGDQLQGNVANPSWVNLLRELLAYRTDALAAVQGPDAALGSYFAWLTVEHSHLPTLNVHFIRQALRHNPGSARLLDSLTANTGVSVRHTSTIQALRQFNAALAQLADEKTTPPPVRDALRRIAPEDPSAVAVAAALDALSAAPAEPGQLLPWSTYAAIRRDELFLASVRRLIFLRFGLGVDASDTAAALWPALKNHRYATYIETFDQERSVAKPDVMQRLEAMAWKDAALNAAFLEPYLARIGAQETGSNLAIPIRWQIEQTAYGAAHAWSLDPKNPMFGITSVREIDQLFARHAPNHPLAVAVELQRKWEDVEPRLPEIEKQAGNPVIAYALGKAYAANHRPADARRTLEKVAAVFPDRNVYEELAGLAKADGDLDAWIEIWERYIAQSEDLGLDHSTVRVEIANELVRKKQYERALKHAQAAATSGSGNSMITYAHVLTCLKRYDNAELIMRSLLQRYGSAGAYYRWCRTTGRGDLNRALAAFKEWKPGNGVTQKSWFADYGAMHYIEGELAEAVQLWEQTDDGSLDWFHMLLATLGRIEQNRWADAKPRLEKMFKLAAQDPRGIVYRAAMEQIVKCIDDPTAVPDRAVARINIHPDADAARGNVAYVLGRVCELRGNLDEAKWWYVTAIEAPGHDFVGRPFAAMALRRLGDEYYK